MLDKQKFEKFFSEVGVRAETVAPDDIVLEMDKKVSWSSGLSVGQLWFLFGKDGEYLGYVDDETMEFEPKKK